MPIFPKARFALISHPVRKNIQYVHIFLWTTFDSYTCRSKTFGSFSICIGGLYVFIMLFFIFSIVKYFKFFLKTSGHFCEKKMNFEKKENTFKQYELEND